MFFPSNKDILNLSNCRNLIINKLNSLKEKDNFDKNSMKWKNISLNNIHISDLNWDDLDDESLIFMYEWCLIRSIKAD